jgi:L-iditol 2-dehydrogenase
VVVLVSNTAAVLHGAGELRIEDRPEPEPGPGQVLVAVEAVGVCGSDVHYFEHGRIGQHVVRAPMVLGHEAAGTIVAVGAGVDPGRVGELVAIEPGVPDFTCDQCLTGRYNLCPNIQFLATPPVHGAMVQRLTTVATFAHPAPAGLTAEQAAMAEPVSVGVWACRRADVRLADRVLVTGAGPIGLFAAQVARAAGAGEVTVTDTNEFRLDVARGLGFTARRATDDPSGEFDVLLECSGVAAAVTGGLAQLAPAGRAVLVGMGADTIGIDVPLIQERELTLTGLFRYAQCYPAALRLISTGRVDVDRVITHRFPLREAQAAMTISRHDPRALKAVVDPAQ